MEFTDIHIHALFAVDDGAKTETEMIQMIGAAYRDGTKTICLTPHYHPGYFGDNTQAVRKAFSVLRGRAQALYPDLKLYLGNELRYAPGCVAWLDEGLCRTLGDSDYVLVDFSEDAPVKTIMGGLEDLLNGGYLPVLAHVERYRSLRGKKQLLQQLRGKGVLIQVDAASVLGGFGFMTKHWTGTMLKARLVDIIASDSHGYVRRSPELSKCCRHIEKKYSTTYARRLFQEVPRALLRQKNGEKGTETMYE